MQATVKSAGFFGALQSLDFMAGNMFRVRSVTRKTPSIPAEPPVKGLHGLWSQTLLATLFIHFQGRALVRAPSAARRGETTATTSLSRVEAITHSHRGATERGQRTSSTEPRICTFTAALTPFLRNHLSLFTFHAVTRYHQNTYKNT